MRPFVSPKKRQKIQEYKTERFPNQQQVDQAIANIGNLADLKVFLRKLTRIERKALRALGLEK